MPGLVPRGQAFNQTRQLYLATDLAVAETHWSRLRGLLGASEGDFRNGGGPLDSALPGRSYSSYAVPHRRSLPRPRRARWCTSSTISSPGASPPSACRPPQSWSCPKTRWPQQELRLGDRIEIKMKEDV